MTRIIKALSRSVAVGLMVTGGLSACGESGTEPDEFTIADLAGSWEATELSLTAKDVPGMGLDLVAAGGAALLSTQPSGNFTGTALLPGALMGAPEMGVITLPLAGVMRLTAESTLRIDFIPEIPPIFTSMEPDFVLTGNVLTLVSEDAVYDFDGDTVNDQGTFRAVFVRN